MLLLVRSFELLDDYPLLFGAEDLVVLLIRSCHKSTEGMNQRRIVNSLQLRSVGINS